MNERPPSGYTPDYDAYTYDAYSTGAYQAVGTLFADDTTTGTYGYIPPQTPFYGYDQLQAPAPQQSQDYAYGTGYSYDHGRLPDAQPEQQQSYDPYGYPAGATYYDTGTYDAQQFASYQQPQAPQQDWDSGAYPAYGYGYAYDASGDTGVYEQFPQQQYEQQQYEQPQQTRQQHAYEQQPPYEYQEPAPEPQHGTGVAAEPDAYAYTYEYPRTHEPDLAAVTDHAEEPAAAAERHDYAADGFEPGVPAARSRRRKPAKRSALLTVAVPSVAVMGVAAVGAAAVTGVGVAQDTGKAQADAPTATGKAPTTQLDRQLAGVSQDASDFADRASRTQERIDLKDRQAAAKRAAAAAAARKEALRPKFVLPVKQKGLSAYFGQAGVNWMAVHTGIDFPVMVGTPVVAVTDGTVRTQWNSSYGNMAIVTAPDGTETWYCHLSSTKIRSGSVKAGTVIAYSGNTGNTTGPHLHLEVRPNGGSPIDPLPWLLKHGLDPR
ncbi:M23 family metallopeptidase [Actinacidiphila paucisporea]|uniref:Murein DD-endopeptidase MepM and murein hydrolase activator NlpD, contain LysM domain n=1 Tax=Actinacidiphila paucisporea TaxID=310782 RepID=A0A1M6U233_9ACTN|nr:M23 family metallopeptidase [Actinacidiphila paucisporea]SHK63204.1 Murein DD-endopeptidase MepM and murein hydrolase activator NlpD, contain LysM domain [Actinacidiphila paucisporea]